MGCFSTEGKIIVLSCPNWNLIEMQKTVNPLHTDTLYNSKILYINCICTNHVSVQIEFDFITTEIQFNVKLFGDKHCCCKDGCLYGQISNLMEILFMS